MAEIAGEEIKACCVMRNTSNLRESGQILQNTLWFGDDVSIKELIGYLNKKNDANCCWIYFNRWFFCTCHAFAICY